MTLLDIAIYSLFFLAGIALILGAPAPIILVAIGYVVYLYLAG